MSVEVKNFEFKGTVWEYEVDEFYIRTAHSSVLVTAFGNGGGKAELIFPTSEEVIEQIDTNEILSWEIKEDEGSLSLQIELPTDTVVLEYAGGGFS